MNGNPAGGSAAEAPTVLSFDVAALADGPPLAAGWPLWQRFGFRFLLVYYVLYAFPRPVSSLLETALGVVALVDGWVKTALLGELPFRWFGHWVKELGKVETQGWQPLTTQLAEWNLTPYSVIHQPTGSGDTGHDIARMLVIALAASLLASLWSLLQRGPGGHGRLARWLHLFVRFDLAFTMLGYGLAKFYGGQFGELSLDRLTQEIGDTWPMPMVGTFMQASKPYELFGGGCEVLAGLLLFSRRTALLGAVAAFATMTNVCALNWLCGVPVKLYSAHLLVAAALLMAPYAGNLWALFVRNRPTRAVDLAVVRSRWAAWPLGIAGWVWVGSSLLLTHLGGTAEKPWMKGREKGALYGVWTVDAMLLDGVEVPITDATRWRFLAIDRGTLAWAREATGQRRNFEFVLDATTQVAQVKPRTGAPAAAGEAAAPEPWTCEVGTKVMPVDPPLLLRNEERGRKVDGERRTLVVKGKLGDKQLELRTHAKQFRLQTGFRLRQELPDFW